MASSIAPDLLYPLRIISTKLLDEMLYHQQQHKDNNHNNSYDPLEYQTTIFEEEYPYFKESDIEKICQTVYTKNQLKFSNSDYTSNCKASLLNSDWVIPNSVKNRFQLANHFYEQLNPSKTMFRQAANGGQMALFGKYLPFSLTGKLTRKKGSKMKAYSLVQTYNKIGTNKCTQLGWPQNDSDCWIDSYLYMIFMNDNLSPIFSKYCNNVIYNSSPSSYEYKIVRLINMYLHVLKEKANTSLYAKYKSRIKFCICVFGLQLLHEKKIHNYSFGIDKYSVYWYIKDGAMFDLIQTFMVLFAPYLHNNLYDILYNDEHYNGLVNIPHNAKYGSISRLKGELEGFTLPNENIIYQVILHNLETGTQAIDFKSLENILVISNNSYYKLESISFLNEGHIIAYTKCDGKWRYYDDEMFATEKYMAMKHIASIGNSTYVEDAEITPITKQAVYSKINELIKNGDALYLIYLKGRRVTLVNTNRSNSTRKIGSHSRSHSRSN